jgi:hypothetical protein
LKVVRGTLPGPGLFLLICCWLSQSVTAASCPPAGFDRPALEALRTAKFEIAERARRQALAEALLPCLAHADPVLRDGVAFEAYSTWMRGDLLDTSTRSRLLEQLIPMLGSRPADPGGFRQPFAALVLSEVARTDRLAAWMTTGQRARLIDETILYLTSLRDYRGFVAREGFRHGVAHSADLVTQLVLNPAVDRAALDRLLAAVASQVTPAGEHSYIDGESERLARAVLYAAQRGLHSADEWQAWLLNVSSPAPLPDWAAAFQSRAGLAKRHNLYGFLFALYVNVRESGDPKMQVLLPGLQAVFKTL